MKRTQWYIALLCILVSGLLAGCGGSSGPGSAPTTTTTTTTPPAASQSPTKSILKLSTQGVLPQGTQLSGLGVTIQLPPGTTVATDSTAPVTVSSGVVTISGVAAQAGNSAMLPPVYKPATSTAPGTLELVIAGNFGVGEFATINCSTSSGSTPPTSSNVTPISFSPTDQLLRPVTGLSAVVSVTLIP